MISNAANGGISGAHIIMMESYSQIERRHIGIGIYILPDSEQHIGIYILPDISIVSAKDFVIHHDQ